MSRKVRMTLFALTLGAIVIVTGINVYSVMAEDDEPSVSHEQMQDVIDENQQLEQELERMENEQAMQEPAAMQERQEALQETAGRFVQTVYTEDAQTYESRKDEAETIMQDDLHGFLFSEDEQEETEQRAMAEDVQFFAETGELNQEEATIMARFSHTYSQGSTGDEETTMTFIELDAEQQEDGSWIIQDFRDAVESMEGEEAI